MKKLFLSVVSLMATASAFAELSYDNAYWIIKDGKMTDNVQIWEYDEEDLGVKVANEMKDTVVNGENVVVYKQITTDFLDVRLKFNEENPLDLSTNYVMVFEYMIPESHTGTQINEGNKPLWMFGYAADQSSLKAKNATHAPAFTFIDAKWGEAEKWVTSYKYVYAPSSLQKLYGMNFTYAREYVITEDHPVLKEFPYIKNMAFVSIKEGKPFYNENFDGFGVGEFYLEKLPVTKKSISFVGDIKPVLTPENTAYWKNEVGISALYVFRDFLPDAESDQDGSGYIDCEQLHALQVETSRDSIVFPGIEIPAETETIYSKMLIKKHKNEDNVWEDALPSEYSKADLPILLKFNTGEVVDLAKDTIKEIWTKFEGEVAVPTGATTVDLIFKGAKAGYLVDDILLSSKKFRDVKVEKIEAESFEVVAYVDENGDIVVLNGEIVAAYNMEGRKATKADKVVAIIVKNENGQLASKVMIRK